MAKCVSGCVSWSFWFTCGPPNGYKWDGWVERGARATWVWFRTGGLRCRGGNASAARGRCACAPAAKGTTTHTHETQTVSNDFIQFGFGQPSVWVAHSLTRSSLLHPTLALVASASFTSVSICMAERAAILAFVSHSRHLLQCPALHSALSLQLWKAKKVLGLTPRGACAWFQVEPEYVISWIQRFSFFHIN
jgi:hypothetical protein